MLTWIVLTGFAIVITLAYFSNRAERLRRKREEARAQSIVNEASRMASRYVSEGERNYSGQSNSRRRDDDDFTYVATAAVYDLGYRSASDDNGRDADSYYGGGGSGGGGGASGSWADSSYSSPSYSSDSGASSYTSDSGASSSDGGGGGGGGD